MKEKSKKIKVMHIVHSLDIGGLERLVISLIKNSEYGLPIDYAVTCLDNKGILAHELDNLAQVYSLNRLNISFFTLIYRLILVIKKEKIKILHCHNYVPLLTGTIVKVLFFNKLNLIYTDHYQLNTMIKKRDKIIFKYCLKFVNRQVCVSDNLKRYFNKNHYSKRFEVIQNGIQKPVVNPKRISEIRSLILKGEDKFIIGTAVRMAEQKGLTYLISAANLLLKKYKDLLFLMVGDGPLRGALWEQAKAAGIENNFIFTGYKEDAINYISSMDIFVLPSLWEGLPLVLLEASALGKPIVATNVGGNEEIISNDLNGIIVPPANSKALADGIERLYLSHELRKTLSENARESFEKYFNIHILIKKYNTIYMDMTRNID